MEAVNYDETIDHVLVGHLKDNFDRLGLDSRLQMSVYYLQVKGGLTTSDLLNDLANDDKVTKLPNSELFKTQFMEKLADIKLDNHVREKV